jgi:hypothetical protein
VAKTGWRATSPKGGVTRESSVIRVVLNGDQLSLLRSNRKVSKMD